MISRILKKQLLDDKKSVLLLGPRQVGKSTLCAELSPDFTINLADEEQYAAHLKDPALVKRVTAPEKIKVVVIDEVQRIPSILNTVQFIIDNNPQKRFILTGSSARKLKHGNANLLPGRLIVYQLPPLTYWEVKDNFDLKKALVSGMLPEIYLNDNMQDVLDSYSNTYLREEIKAEALVKNVGDYGRFLDLSAIKSGEQINYSKLGSDAEIKKDTIRRYFQILEDTLLIHRLESFTKVVSPRRAQQRDKFLFFDTGVRNGILKILHNNFSTTELGSLFEQWIILQCVYFNQLRRKNWKLSYFRTDQGDEVDLIIETQHKLLAVEIKYTQNLKKTMCRGMNFFEQVVQKPVTKQLVYLGKHDQEFEDKSTALNFEKFLLQLDSL